MYETSNFPELSNFATTFATAALSVTTFATAALSVTTFAVRRFEPGPLRRP